MNTIKTELMKLVKNPAIWILFTVFIGYDIYTVNNYAGYDVSCSEIKELNEIINRTGVDLSDNHTEIDNLLDSKNQLEAFYANYVKMYEHIYDDLDMTEIKETKERMTNFYPTGRYKEFIDRNYEKIQLRVEEIRSSGECNYAFYPGNVYKINKTLYYTLLPLLMIEMFVMTVFSVLYLMDYERINKTEDIIYTSSEGRCIIFKKLFAGIVAGLLFSISILSVSFVLFFEFIEMNGLWETPISSFMYFQTSLFLDIPYITFWKMTFAEYLALALLTSILTTLVIGLLAGAVQFFTENSLLSSLLLSTLFIVFLAIPLMIKKAGFLKTFSAMTPSSLWYLCSSWFRENDLSLSFAGWEFYVLVIWTIISFFLIFIGNKRFINKDIFT